MNPFCDLHTHSVFSDGTWTPEELIREACSIGLSAIALTDHNTVDGLNRFLNAAKGTEIEAIPGVEFSTDYLDMDIHIVALYVMPKHFAQVTELMTDGRVQKDASNRNLIDNLRKIGFDIDYDGLCAAVPGGQINRAHIARKMLENGWVKDMQQAFREYLEPHCGLYVPPHRPGSFEMIRFIRSIGAVPVMAHPFLKLNEEQLRVFLKHAKMAGLIGMETEYVSFDQKATALAKKIASEFGLLQSGGSDFHGDNKPGISLGTGRGNLHIPISFRNALRQIAYENEMHL